MKLSENLFESVGKYIVGERERGEFGTPELWNKENKIIIIILLSLTQVLT